MMNLDYRKVGMTCLLFAFMVNLIFSLPYPGKKKYFSVWLIKVLKICGKDGLGSQRRGQNRLRGRAHRLGHTCEIAHLGSCYLGRYPWEVDNREKSVRKVPNIVPRTTKLKKRGMRFSQQIHNAWRTQFCWKQKGEVVKSKYFSI